MLLTRRGRRIFIRLHCNGPHLADKTSWSEVIVSIHFCHNLQTNVHLPWPYWHCWSLFIFIFMNVISRWGRWYFHQGSGCWHVVCQRDMLTYQIWLRHLLGGSKQVAADGHKIIILFIGRWTTHVNVRAGRVTDVQHRCQWPTLLYLVAFALTMLSPLSLPYSFTAGHCRPCLWAIFFLVPGKVPFTALFNVRFDLVRP